MIPVSDLYKEKISAPTRVSKPMAIFDMVEHWEYPFASVDASTTMDGYSADQIANGRIRTSSHTLTGPAVAAELCLPHKGWRGTVLSDTTGLLSTEEVLTISYVKTIFVTNFHVVSSRGNHPVDFKIEALTYGEWHTLVEITNNNQAYFSYIHPSIVRLDAVRITISKISALEEPAFIVQAGAITTVVFDEYEVVDLDVLEEKESTGGTVTSNMATITLNNDRKFYTATNMKSPFYSLLRKGMRFSLYIALQVEEDVFEVVPLGTFYTSDWSGPTSGLEVAFSGLDRLQTIWDEDIPMIRAEKDTTLYHMYDRLLTSIGLVKGVDYTIDISVNGPLDWGWIPAKSIGEAFSVLSEATNTVVMCDRMNVIRIEKPLDFDVEPSAEWRDTDQVIDFNNPLRFSDTYSDMAINIYTIEPEKEESSLLRQDITIDPGITVLKGPFEFTSVPVLYVTSVKVTGGKDVDVTEHRYGATTTSFEITNNSDKKQKVSVEMFGVVLKTMNHTHNASFKETHYNIEGRKLSIDSPLIQSEAFAKQYAVDVLRIKSDPLSTVSLEVRGDPAITLSDVVVVDNPTDMLPPMNIIPIRQKIVWSDGISVELDAVRQIVRKSKTGYLGMGMGSVKIY